MLVEAVSLLALPEQLSASDCGDNFERWIIILPSRPHRVTTRPPCYLVWSYSCFTSTVVYSHHHQSSCFAWGCSGTEALGDAPCVEPLHLSTISFHIHHGRARVDPAQQVPAASDQCPQTHLRSSARQQQSLWGWSTVPSSREAPAEWRNC